jgi:hypothetical protein
MSEESTSIAASDRGIGGFRDRLPRMENGSAYRREKVRKGYTVKILFTPQF